MPIIAVGLFDTIEANIASLLTAFSAQQAAMDSTVAFKVFRRRMRPLAVADLPAAHVWLASLGSVAGGRSSQTMTAHFNVDLHVKGAEGALPSDEAAMARLYYFVQQTLHAMYALVQADFGLAAGVLARKHGPAYQTIIQRQPETEEQLVFGQWSLDVEYPWEAADAQTEALTRLVLTEQVKLYAPSGGVDKTFP